MNDSLRDRILNTLINNTPPKYLAMPGDLSDLVTALIRALQEDYVLIPRNPFQDLYDQSVAGMLVADDTTGDVSHE